MPLRAQASKPSRGITKPHSCSSRCSSAQHSQDSSSGLRSRQGSMESPPTGGFPAGCRLLVAAGTVASAGTAAAPRAWGACGAWAVRRPLHMSGCSYQRVASSKQSLCAYLRSSLATGALLGPLRRPWRLLSSFSPAVSLTSFLSLLSPLLLGFLAGRCSCRLIKPSTIFTQLASSRCIHDNRPCSRRYLQRCALWSFPAFP
jgi:hypothetical protein